MSLTIAILSIIPFRKRSPSPPPPDNGNRYLQMVFEHYNFIYSQCRNVVFKHNQKSRGEIEQENEADELLLDVLEHLIKDDYKALREFKGTAKLSTYLTTIISHVHVDRDRSKKGRDRSQDRAEQMGETAELLYEMDKRGFALHEAHSELAETYGIREPMKRLEEMLNRIRGRVKVVTAQGDGDRFWVPAKEVVTDQGIEIVQADPADSPEEQLSSSQLRNKRQLVIQALLETLDGEERSIIAIRYPLDEDEIPQSVREIASMLRRTEKAVDNQRRRILKEFKEMLLKRGVALDDLL